MRKLSQRTALNVRLDGLLRQRLKKEAKSNRCSLNAEIIFRLQQSFDVPKLSKAIADRVVEELRHA